LRKRWFALILFPIIIAILLLLPELLQGTKGCTPQLQQYGCVYGGCYYYLDEIHDKPMPWNIWWLSLFNRNAAKEWVDENSCQPNSFEYSYAREKAICNDLCRTHIENGCVNITSAAVYCKQKVSIDIDANHVAGEKGHYGVINAIPYCEDGLYCFHVYSCGCGSYELDSANCLTVLKDYYTTLTGNETVANKAVCDLIQPGTCEKDPRNWGNVHDIYSGEPFKYQPVLLFGNQSQYGVGGSDVLGADFWWRRAGYAGICGSS